MVSKLLIKTLGNSIKTLKKTPNMCAEIPEAAHSFDYVKGVSLKKGNFEIFSYRDINGKLITRESIYSKNKKIINRIDQLNYEGKEKILDTKILKNGKVQECTSSTFYLVNDKTVLQTKENISSALWDEHSINFLQSGETPRRIKYPYFWDETTPAVYYNDRSINFKNQDYLPILVSNHSAVRINERFYHIAALNEKNNGLAGITPKPNRIPQNDLDNMNKIGYAMEFTDQYSGQINITEEITHSYYLLELLGHEYNHAKHFSDIARLKSHYKEFLNIPTKELQRIQKSSPDRITFAKESHKYGLIDDNTPRGEYLNRIDQSMKNYYSFNTVKEHDKLMIEKPAIKTEKKEKKKYIKLLKEILTFFMQQK